MSPVLRPPPTSTSSSRPSREDRTVKERVDALLERIDRAKDILVHDCSKGDRFGVLALGTLERNLKELVPVIKLIEQSRDTDDGGAGQGRRRDDEDIVRAMEDQDARSRPFRSHEALSSRREPSGISKDSPDQLVNGDRARTPMDKPESHPSSRRPSDSPRPLSPASRPLPVSRSDSRISSNSSKQARQEDPASNSATRSISNFFNRAKGAVTPSNRISSPVSVRDHVPKEEPRNEEEEEEVEEVSLARDSRRRKDRHLRQASAASDSSSAHPATSSRRQRTTRPSVSSDEEEPKPVRTEERDTRRSRSRSGRASSRAGTSFESRKVLDMASAPAKDSEEESERVSRRKGRTAKKERIVRLVEERIIKTLARESDQATRATLALVSRDYYKVVKSILYSSVEISHVSQVSRLADVLESNPSLADSISSLTIVPLDNSPTLRVEPSTFLPSLQRLVSLLPRLERLDEDFTKSEWDVQSISSSSTEYPLVASSPSKDLEKFTSKRCWWEIGAIDELFRSHPRLSQVVFGGAAMDREWRGSKLKQSLIASPRTDSEIVFLSVSQVMHEDTLSVLLLSSSNPRFRSLSIGFQSIGPSDDDTPIDSIPLALKHVSSTLTHLTLLAPRTPSSSRVSEDTSILLEEILPLFPHLTHLTFSETLDPTPVAIATPKILTRAILPKKLRTFKVRQLFSISTGDVLKMLDDPEAIPVLEDLDIEWAVTKKRDEGKEEEEGVQEEVEESLWWKERHVAKIEQACLEYGIKCRLSKGERKLSIG